jgi:hypothetical protein
MDVIVVKSCRGRTRFNARSGAITEKKMKKTKKKTTEFPYGNGAVVIRYAIRFFVLPFIRTDRTTIVRILLL